MPTHLTITSAWQHMRVELRSSVGDSAYEAWLEPLEVKRFDGSVLVLEGQRGTDAWVADRFGRVLDRCAREHLGPAVTVAFANDPATRAHAALLRPARGEDPARGPAFNPRYTFAQFVIGDSNRVAHAAALAVAEAPAQTVNPLFLYAPSGLGKTHLLQAIGNYITRFDPSLKVIYTTVEAFTNGFVAALKGKQVDRFKRLYREIDVLLIDDVQFLASKAKTEEEFFHTFDALYDSGRQLVLTCDRLPDELGGLDRRLRQRFGSGLVEHLSAPDRQTRVAILRKRAATDGLSFSDPGLIDQIADRVTGNVRALEGALQKLAAHHSLTGRPVDGALVEAVLGVDDGPGDTPPPSTAIVHATTIQEIQAAVAQAFNISTADLTSTSRRAEVSWPRQLAIYLARELTGAPLAAIGAAFGGRSHATVLHAQRRVLTRVADSVEDAAELRRLTALFS